MVTSYKHGLVLLVVASVALALVAGGSPAPAPRPKGKAAGYVAPPHEVVYWYTVPAAERTDHFEITYLDATGRKRSLTQPGFPPAWVQVIRLPRGATALELTVRSSATSSAPMIWCRIQLGERVVRIADGNPCRVRLNFPLTPQEDVEQRR